MCSWSYRRSAILTIYGAKKVKCSPWPHVKGSLEQTMFTHIKLGRTRVNPSVWQQYSTTDLTTPKWLWKYVNMRTIDGGSGITQSFNRANQRCSELLSQFCTILFTSPHCQRCSECFHNFAQFCLSLLINQPMLFGFLSLPVISSPSHFLGCLWEKYSGNFRKTAYECVITTISSTWISTHDSHESRAEAAHGSCQL